MTFVNFHFGAIARLLRALHQNAETYQVAIEVIGHEEQPWASATFAGHRLRLTLALEGGDRQCWLSALPQAELPVRGAFVADLHVEHRTEDTARVAILLIDDA